MSQTIDSLAIERVPWGDLKPHQANPRNGDVDAIAESVRVNGIYRPIIVAQDGTILAGHHLWFALGQLQRKHVDVVRIPIDPYSTEAQRILVADNRTADLGNYDRGLLIDLLKQIQDDEGLPGTGYTDKDLEKLLKWHNEDWDNRDILDIADSELTGGTRWRLGRHVLVCGDSTDPASWEGCPPLAACITDPPYGINYSGSIHYKRPAISGDDGAVAIDLLLGARGAMPLRPGAIWYLFTASGPEGARMTAAMDNSGILRQGLVWVKPVQTFCRSDYHYKHESIWYGWEPDGPHLPVRDRTRTSVLTTTGKRKSLSGHPTEKPVELIETLVSAHEWPGSALIADPFAGTGAIMEACERHGVSAWMVEIEPSYCDIILDRFKKMSGQEPVRL